MKNFFKGYLVSKVSNGRRWYQKEVESQQWTNEPLQAFFFNDKESAIKSMEQNMNHWQSYYERNKITTNWEVLEVEMKVTKIEI